MRRAEAGGRDAQARRVPRRLRPRGCSASRRSTTCTSASSSSRSRPRREPGRASTSSRSGWRRRSPNAPLNQSAAVGWLSANTLIEGIKAAGVNCPTPQGVHQQPAPGEGLHGRRVLRPPIDFAEVYNKPFLCVYYVQVENKQFVPQFDGKPFCAQAGDHEQQDHQASCPTTTRGADDHHDRPRRPVTSTSTAGRVHATRPAVSSTHRHTAEGERVTPYIISGLVVGQHLRHLGARPGAHVHVVARLQLRARRDRVLDRDLLLLPDPTERLEHRGRGAVHDPGRRAAARPRCSTSRCSGASRTRRRPCGWCRPSGSGWRCRRWSGSSSRSRSDEIFQPDGLGRATRRPELPQGVRHLHEHEPVRRDRERGRDRDRRHARAAVHAARPGDAGDRRPPAQRRRSPA